MITVVVAVFILVGAIGFFLLVLKQSMRIAKHAAEKEKCHRRYQEKMSKVEGGIKNE